MSLYISERILFNQNNLTNTEHRVYNVSVIRTDPLTNHIIFVYRLFRNCAPSKNKHMAEN